MTYRAVVLIPFHRRETDADCVPGDVIEVEGEELSRIRAVNVNMVDVVGVVAEPVEEPETESEVVEPVEGPAKTKPRRKNKQQ